MTLVLYEIASYSVREKLKRASMLIEKINLTGPPWFRCSELGLKTSSTETLAFTDISLHKNFVHGKKNRPTLISKSARSL